MKNYIYKLTGLSAVLVMALVISGCGHDVSVAPEESARQIDNVPEDNNTVQEQIFEKSDPVDLPPSSLKNVNTKKLILSNSNLKSLPSEIGNLTKVEEFYVNNNSLTGALPAEIRKMSKLRVLDASDNQLTGIPAEIGQLKNLVTLDLSNNQIDTMPNEIYNIKDNLKTLDLSGNTYSEAKLKEIQAGLPNTNVIY